MPRTVLLFPGQGAYVPRDLNTLTRELPELRLTFEDTDYVLDCLPSDTTEALANGQSNG